MTMLIVNRLVYVAAIKEHEIGMKDHHTAFRSVMESYDIDKVLFASAEYVSDQHAQSEKATITYRVREDYIPQKGGEQSDKEDNSIAVG